MASRECDSDDCGWFGEVNVEIGGGVVWWNCPSCGDLHEEDADAVFPRWGE